jgi:hypothetical protein
MKAILEFNLPEDECNYRIASRATDWALTVLEMETHLRTLIKHSDRSENELKDVLAIRDNLHDILDRRGISLDHMA